MLSILFSASYLGACSKIRRHCNYDTETDTDVATTAVPKFEVANMYAAQAKPLRQPEPHVQWQHEPPSQPPSPPSQPQPQQRQRRQFEAQPQRQHQSPLAQELQPSRQYSSLEGEQVAYKSMIQELLLSAEKEESATFSTPTIDSGLDRDERLKALEAQMTVVLHNQATIISQNEAIQLGQQSLMCALQQCRESPNVSNSVGRHIVGYVFIYARPHLHM